MPSLNVTLPLTNPLLSDKFHVVRRTQSIGDNGRLVIAAQTFYNVVGVVTAGGANDLDRGENYEIQSRSINVVTRFPLLGVADDNLPDVVVWRGGLFLLKHIDYYGHFGPGFVQAECESQNKIDGVLSASYYDAVSNLNFNQPSKSGNILLVI